MIIVQSIGALSQPHAGVKLPDHGLVLSAEPHNLRGFPLLGEKVDILPAGVLEREADAVCECDHRGRCGACKLVARVRILGLVEGGA